MKVIKKGKKIKSTMRVTCKNCEAELEIKARDLKECPYNEPGTKIYFYQCPCCRRTNYLNYNDLTEEFRFDLNI